MNTILKHLDIHDFKCSCRVVRALPWLAASLFYLFAAQGVQASEQAYITPQQTYQLALEARTMRDYSAMLGFLRQAAEAGNLSAQELLASVLLAGPALYGTAIQADPCEAAHWIEQATVGGSNVAKHQRIVLNNFRDLPQGRDSCVAKAG